MGALADRINIARLSAKKKIRDAELAKMKEQSMAEVEAHRLIIVDPPVARVRELIAQERAAQLKRVEEAKAAQREEDRNRKLAEAKQELADRDGTLTYRISRGRETRGR